MNESEIATGPFGLKSPVLSTYHQQLWVIAGIETNSKDGWYYTFYSESCILNYMELFVGNSDEAFEKSFEVTVDLYGVDGGKVVKILNHSTRRSRRLECHGGGSCDTFTILHLSFIDYAKYFVVVRFSDLETVHKRYQIKDVHFYVRNGNNSNLICSLDKELSKFKFVL